MCIFAQPVKTVNGTQIFARLSSRGTQFLAYQMNYESAEENAMILPLPIRLPAQADRLRFVDLQAYSHFFADLDEGFPVSTPWFPFGCSGRVEVAIGKALEVFEVGNYIASFVPTLSDFTRLDPRFTLPAAVWSQIPQYANFGFAVFQLAAGALKPHRMAFEFETNLESIYFPTVHIHDGQAHEIERFDHVLYAQHAGMDSRVYAYQDRSALDRSTRWVRSKYLAREFCDVGRAQDMVDGDLLVHRRVLVGEHPNRDELLASLGDPTRPTLNLRSMLAYTPWLVVLGGLVWLLSRRTKLKQRPLVAE